MISVADGSSETMRTRPSLSVVPQRNARRVRGTAGRSSIGQRSERAAPRARPAADRVPADDRDHRADRRNDDRREVDARDVVAATGNEDPGEKPADESPNDPEHDLADDAETLVTLDEEPREITGDRPDDEPGDDSHGFLPPCRHSRGDSTVALGPPNVRSQSLRPDKQHDTRRSKSWSARTRRIGRAGVP